MYRQLQHIVGQCLLHKLSIVEKDIADKNQPKTEKHWYKQHFIMIVWTWQLLFVNVLYTENKIQLFSPQAVEEAFVPVIKLCFDGIEVKIIF